MAKRPARIGDVVYRQDLVLGPHTVVATCTVIENGEYSCLPGMQLAIVLPHNPTDPIGRFIRRRLHDDFVEFNKECLGAVLSPLWGAPQTFMVDGEVVSRNRWTSIARFNGPLNEMLQEMKERIVEEFETLSTVYANCVQRREAYRTDVERSLATIQVEDDSYEEDQEKEDQAA